MDMTAGRAYGAPSKFKRAESIEFRLIFLAAFAVFFAAAVVERVIPLRRILQGANYQSPGSVVAQAKQAANTCAAYAFMG